MTDIDLKSPTLRTRGGMPFRVLADLREQPDFKGDFPILIYVNGCVATLGADGMRYQNTESSCDLIDEPKRVEVEVAIFPCEYGFAACSMLEHTRAIRTPIGRIVVTIEGQGEHARIAGVEQK